MRIDISGSGAVIANLNKLAGNVQRRLVERAGRAALKPVVAAARANVPRDTGNLRKSIGVKKAKRVGRGEVVLSVGPRPGYDWTDEKGFVHRPFKYAIPVEYGHVLKVFGKTTGQFIAPVGFLRRAYESQRVQIVDRFEIELRRRIEMEGMK